MSGRATGRACRTRERLGAAVAAAVLAVASGASRADEVELRGGAPSIECDVASVSGAGAVVRMRKAGLDQERTVPWSEVRAVRGDGLPDGVPRWVAAGESLWRARMRADRGDWPLALPEFARAFDAWRGTPASRDAIAAASGLAEARWRSGEFPAAVVPCFDAIRLARAATATDSAGAPGAADAARALDGRIVDLRAPLPPFVPPFALPATEVDAVAKAVRGLDLGADPALARVVESWCAAAGAPAAGDKDGRPSLKLDAPAKSAIAALDALAALRSDDPSQRASAVAALARARTAMPPWFEPWARAATGRALAEDPADALRARGCALLASVLAVDAVQQPVLAAFVRPVFDAARSGAGPRMPRTMSPALAAQGVASSITVPRDLADRTTEFIERLGDRAVLVAHLEAQVEQELPGDARQAAVTRLARTLASMLEREQDASRREEIAARASSLLRAEDSKDAGAVALRLSLLRARHRAAQRVAEDRRAGRVVDADAEAARGEFASLVQDFTALASNASRARERADLDAARAVGLTAEQVAAEAAAAEDAVRSAQYFRAWAAYYAAWLGRDLAREGWRDTANSAVEWFAALIEPGRPTVDPAEVSVDLRGNEGFASAILGMALASSLVTSPATSDAWFALLDDPRTHASVRLKLPAWRLAALLDRGDAAGALVLLRAGADGTQGIPMALIAAARAVRMEPTPEAAALLTESVGRLASAGRLGDLAAIGGAGRGVEGPGASLFAAVRSATEATRLQSEGRTSDARAAWDVAVEQIAGATAPEAPASVAAGARALLGHLLRGAGRPSEAADAFLAASQGLAGERAGDARWMAVICLDEASRAGIGDAAARAGRAVDAIVADLPGTHAAVRARAWRVTRGGAPTNADIDALLAGSVPAQLAPAARRAAIEGLYRRFRASTGDVRRAAARRALLAGDDEPVGAGDPGTVELRRRAEMAIAVEDRVRAAEAVDALGVRADPHGPLRDELAARRCQVAALEGRLDAAQAFAAEVARDTPWARIAGSALLSAVLRDPAASPEMRASAVAAAVRGQSPPPVAEIVLWVRAEGELARRGQPGIDRTGAREALDAARAAHPGDAALSLADADFRLATGDPAGAAAAIERVLAASSVASEPWFEAKVMQVGATARVDASRARAMLEQVRSLAGGFGSGAAARRFAELDRSLPAPPAERRSP